MSAAVLPQHPAPPRPWREQADHPRPASALVPGCFLSPAAADQAELGLSYSQIGLIMTCKYIASAVANVPGGVVDTVGRKGLLMGVSLFWIGFPYLLIGFTNSYVMLLACIALVGFGNSLWHPPRSRRSAGVTQSARASCSRSTAWANVGDAVAPIVIGAALTLFTWREVVVLNVVPGLVVAALLFVFLGSMRLGSKKAEGETQSFAPISRGSRIFSSAARWSSFRPGRRSVP